MISSRPGATVNAAGNLAGGNVEASGSIMVGSIGNAEHYAGAVIAHGTDATDPESGRLHAQGDVFGGKRHGGKRSHHRR